MPVDRLIGKYDHDLKKVVWTHSSDEVKESVAPAIEGVKEIRAVGLPGQPTFTSRKSYEKAVRDSGHVVVGNDPAGMTPQMREER
jgi:hypothetical protein